MKTLAIIVLLGLANYATAETTESVTKLEVMQVQSGETNETVQEEKQQIEAKIEEKTSIISLEENEAEKNSLKLKQNADKEIIKISGMFCPPDCD